MGYKPISDYGIIGNMLSAALVATDGAIDWCCLPRFDSPSVFAAMLDDEKGGTFHIKPEAPFESHQTYLPNTNLLKTTFQTETGTVTLTDFMPCYQASRRRLVQTNEIHRVLDGTGGEVAMEVVFQPKLNYARGDTSIVTSKYGVGVSQDAEKLALSSPNPFRIDGDKAISRVHSSARATSHLCPEPRLRYAPIAGQLPFCQQARADDSLLAA